ncbi:RNA-metabolising metallo-beta-lactamase [compost metagenome]
MQIDLDGQLYEVRAKVKTLSGYSAHADQEGLVSFALAGTEPARHIVLVHGEQGARMSLAKALKLRFRQCDLPVTVTLA